ncbi:hypothetical protein Misp01_12930 [Microtetraspora sp. NBRC 13810]|uniref:protein kinase domain-containing protein n=1 Tax=Microtetraspora sp. NBRC 13810 TaxID=3030990 RepID=UPI0024A46F5B|nr:serine/threonine protein kinase [Microtetraspora sp. NBRC 13810]GLW06163.1 hypothetical protein Misp01_12930 [Microtetraspora sp. NBRC 13810]
MSGGDIQAAERLGPYRLIRKIGEGGMGVVHLGVDDDGREVAVKVLHPHVAADLKARDRLTREVETMRRVRSPHVAEVLGAQLSGPQPYIATRFAPGRTLEETVLTDGPLSPAALVRLARGLSAALVAIHAADVIHRDLKPANVMLIGGEPLVIDFGIAHLVNATRLTQTGMFVGTPGYLAPEIIRDSEITQLADVHALASTVFFGATGKPPFGTGTFEVVCFNIMEGRARTDLAPGWLRGWLEAALAVEAAERPTAGELHRMARALDPSVTAFHEPTRIESVTRVTEQEPPAGSGTRVFSQDDSFSDLLPPVNYAPSQKRRQQEAAPSARSAPPPAPPPVQAPPYTPAVPYEQGGRAPVHQRPAPPPDQRVAGPPPQPSGPARPLPPPENRPRPYTPPEERRPPYRVGHPLLAVLLLAIIVGAACLFPVVVSAFAVVAVLCLRVGEYLFGDLADRRSARGSSGADPLLVVLGTPWALIRAVLGTVVHVPLAAMFGMCVWGVLAYPGGMSTDVAAAYAAGAFTGGLFVLPGGGKPRKAVSRTLTALVRSPGAAMVTAIVLGALAVFAVMGALTTTASFMPWEPPSVVIDKLTTTFREQTDQASMGAIDLVTGLVGDLLNSLGLGFLAFWS